MKDKIIQDADEWLKNKDCNSQELYFDFCVFSNDFSKIFTPQINELLTRHKWLKDYHITSYGTDFDNLPAYFIDAMELIDRNIIEAMESKSGSN